ncbi:hypothetical protein ELQ35_10475 [Peribacillus cavernae]|uniref:DUF2642 domain-containing protein n=1 Tax=Peribacillus cavernae TaxID=1674310 RepID=A0A433HLV1_9BACI|nr:hypothetical protein [Peribacillus cavernae]MDQ0218907.1 hypothetical protein [Peribacillus cavernae]RUQ29374.1 hypothetical protein ELQ35_10475 [Peribacillus cavernae]
MTHDNSNNIDVNAIHDMALLDHFIDGIGQKVIILSPSFPFLFIGTIVDVVEDLIELDVETTHFSQLEDRTWFIHIHNIEVFYIERPGEPQIPELKDMT